MHLDSAFASPYPFPLCHCYDPSALASHDGGRGHDRDHGRRMAVPSPRRPRTVPFVGRLRHLNLSRLKRSRMMIRRWTRLHL